MTPIATRAAGTTVARGAAKAGDAVAANAGTARAIGVAAASLAGGLALGATLGSRRRSLRFLPARRRTMLGVPIGRKPASVEAAQALAAGARRLAEAGGRASRTVEDVHEIRQQLERANRQSPVEVLLDALTHRRGAHRAEG